ncbi:hypothetical protein [Dokdonia sp.]|uniref:hypothetical protein n=1 Tax=Dokdonia sp. TaxID=2024995 RepID=UPI003263EAE1
MKKFIITSVLALFTMSMITSCEPEISNEEQQELATDPNENCPPNDTNCNGIPDNQENN